MGWWTEAAGRRRQSSARAPSGGSREKRREARDGSPDWAANGPEFEAIMFGRGVFFKAKNSDSIVIVAPRHVSKFSHVLKKLTASGGGVPFFSEERSGFRRAKAVRSRVKATEFQ
jgi:hypothetical protein